MTESNKNLLKKLAKLDVLETESINSTSFVSKDDIIIEKDDGSKAKVILEKDMNMNKLMLMVQVEQLSVLKFIETIIYRYIVGCIILFVIGVK